MTTRRWCGGLRVYGTDDADGVDPRVDPNYDGIEGTSTARILVQCRSRYVHADPASNLAQSRKADDSSICPISDPE